MDLPNSRDFAAHPSADSATARSRAKSYSGSRPNPLSPASRLSQSSLGERPAISRLHRSNTIVHYQDLHSDALQHNPTAVWDPERAGAEPGIDPSKADVQYANLVARSQITLVDFAADRDRYAVHEMWNEEFLDFMKLPRPEWATCRWINVNGLSWDVISSLGKRYKLHRLAIEDLVHGRGRAKVDWYQSSVYIQLQLQKLVRTTSLAGSQFDHAKHHLKKKSFWQKLRRSRHPNNVDHSTDGTEESIGDNLKPISTAMSWETAPAAVPGVHYRTLQRYRSEANIERNLYMERNSPLTSKGLAVSIEQVSIFLTDDNTIIAFFEHSADDIEPPILKRLETEDTILRTSADASLLFQALIDAMTDLFFAVAAAYEDIISELELEVLQDPSIRHSKLLYILQSELTLLRNNIAPMTNIIDALRDHRKGASAQESPIPNIAKGERSKSAANLTATTAVSISALARTYLGDVEDHCLLLLQTLDTLRGTTTNMIDLIFNSLAAYQNNNMATLTAVTIFFLPLTFLTGYFGMNFEFMWSVKSHSDEFFWIVAVPAMAVTILILGAPRIKRAADRIMQTLWIKKTKERRQKMGFGGKNGNY